MDSPLIQFAGHAPDSDESKIFLEYIKPLPQSVESVRGNIFKIRDRMGCALNPIITTPPKGFLRRPLSPKFVPPGGGEPIDQQEELSRLLMITYALRNLDDQQQLRNIRIDESGEKVCHLPSFLEKEGVTATFSEGKFHEACGSWESQERVFYVREEVARKIALVCRGLQKIFCMLNIEDAWRPWQVQKGLFIRRLVGIAQKYRHLSWQEVKMVTMSFTAAAPGVAGHQAAAAVDARIRRIGGKQHYLPLGNKYAEGGVYVSLDSPHITAEQWETRMYFAAVMRMAGLKLLRTENWHASHGDRGMGMDGKDTMLTAQYGPIQTFDRSTGEIVPYEPDFIEGNYLNDDEMCALIERSREMAGKEPRYSKRELFSMFLGEKQEHRKK